MALRSQRRGIDRSLMVVIIVLVLVGLVLLYSTSAYNGQNKFQDPFYYLKKQAFATLLGMGCMWLVAKLDYHMLRRFAPAAYIVSIVLAVLVLLIGDEYNGSKRWLSFGPISFQPSEFSKVAVIVFLSWLVEKAATRIVKLRFMALVLASVLPIVALVGAGNLSTAVIILGIATLLIFVASPKYSQFVLIGACGVAFMGIFLALESYRLERILIWQNPEQYEKGYQTLQGLYAIGSGGLFGNGIGQSIQKLGFVPEAQNDMIFSIVCEELGLVGAVTLIVLFLLLIWRIYLVATHAKDLFGALLATGVMAHMMLQVLLNIAVVTNTIPNTGITLPFVSYGGTSVLFLLTEMGVVLSISNLIE